MIPAPAPILSFISSSSQSRFLLLWNLDAFHCWQDIISWIASIKAFLPGSVKIDKVYHTYEKDNHLFWLNFKSVQSAISFQGIVAGRRTVDNGSIGCDFVTGEVFNDFVPISRDSWDPSHGLNADLSLTEPLRSRDLQKLPLNQRIQPAQDAEIFEFSSLSRKKRRKLAKTPRLHYRLLPQPKLKMLFLRRPLLLLTTLFPPQLLQWTCPRIKRKLIVTNIEDVVVNIQSNLRTGGHCDGYN
ncbi:hypothetical protein CVT26_002943 [Gymnopilus dilepis]|uniref:Uncharacterized protein n=1 Tax=Gymnopilus dilepis TaxID=231916 RepID=A0A409Y4N8_9AGAR|nr:hypothetical protein CVT26_002943 [Gymnopilus dilepis]